MRLTILGSSSAANGYVLDNGHEALVLECGCPLVDLQRAVDFDLRRVAGVLLTHEHGDHARHALKYIKSALPLYASEGTLMKLPEEVLASTFSHPVRPPKPFRVGGFRVLPFDVKHDAALLAENARAGIVSEAQRVRVIESHMSLDTCRETLQANDLSETRRIILIHLSDRNSDATQFKKTIARATGREVITADRGQTIELT